MPNPNNLLPFHFKKGENGDAEAKRKGWMKRMRGRNLLKVILEQKYVGNDAIRQQASDYFGCDPDDITNEAMMYFMQVLKAINKQDTGAFETVMNRAHGKIRDYGDEDDEQSKDPVINIHPVASVDDLNIAESEEEIDQNKIS